MRNDDVYYDETVQHTWLAMRQHAKVMKWLVSLSRRPQFAH